ncbi:FGFR1 oncogene partner 2 -like protein [Halotydeus destructor]|nr:FGFR1 oncogene partner 2 -like protein [Halotydeus destructor]
MAISVQQVLNDAKKLSTRLKDFEHEADQMLGKAQALDKTVDTMKEYHEDLQHLSSTNQNNMPRSSLIYTIQRESKQLRLLENENRELKSALEDHQFALELIMSKYRQHVTQLIKSRNFGRFSQSSGSSELDNEMSKVQVSKILEMAAVMKRAAEVDEQRANRDLESLVCLRTENQGLRGLLKIAQSTGSVETTPAVVSKEEKEVQTDPIDSEPIDSEPIDSEPIEVGLELSDYFGGRDSSAAGDLNDTVIENIVK